MPNSKNLKERTCTKCKKTKAISDFYWNSGEQNHHSRCKPCFNVNNNSQNNYKKTDAFKKSISEASKRAYLNHKEKWLARAKARYAVKKGILIKPKKCEVCEEIKPLQGHHEDYSKPLEVIWLCYSCHAEADKLLESLTNQKEI